MNAQTATVDPLGKAKAMVAACMQCGTCTATCPNSESMDLSPRRIWRLLQLGLADKVFASKTFWLCSACYECRLKCPRGIKTTEAMAELKRAAQAAEAPGVGRSSAFYRAFVDNVRANGRVREGTLMASYMLSARDLKLPLSFAGVGMRMMGKGKVGLGHKARDGGLEALFKAVRDVEGRM